MSDTGRLAEQLDRMQAAAEQAVLFIDGMTQDMFAADVRTQMAVAMTLVLLGDAAARIASNWPHLLQDHPDIPWSQIRGMRNLVAHNYYELELPVVWRTVRDDLPVLVAQIRGLHQWRAEGE